jgi:hypothetical protein
MFNLLGKYSHVSDAFSRRRYDSLHPHGDDSTLQSFHWFGMCSCQLVERDGVVNEEVVGK